MTCQHRGCRNPATRDGRRCLDGRCRLYCSDRCSGQARRERRYARLRSAGLCAWCGDVAVTGKALCSDCSEANNAPRRVGYWNGMPMTREQALQILGRTA